MVLVLSFLIAAAPEEALLQYGAIGFIAFLALLAVRQLFNRQIQAHERDIARADRAEAELNELNKLIREQLVVQLTRAADSIARVTELLSNIRHDRDR